MEEDKIPAPPREGVVYGEIAYWFLVAGVLIAIIGLGIYLGSPGYINKSSLLSYLWSGYNCQTIWQDVGSGQVVSWFSSIKMLNKGDMLATLGIAISGFGAVFGMWGATIQMFRGGKRKTYLIFALIIAIVLTLSALGLISLGD